MASGDAYDLSDRRARSDEAVAAELNVDFARKGLGPSSTVSAPPVRYGAFISYSHAASAEVARGLQKWLQTYAKPWWRWRAVNVFRDETDLTAAPALWSRISDALDQSSHFVLLASPEAAQSKWIKREIRYWLGDQNAGALDGVHLDAPLANPRPERIATLLIALTAGDIGWDDETANAGDIARGEKGGNPGDFDWSKTTAVPRLLSGVFREEPQWVDLRTIVQREELRTSLSRSNSEFMRAVAQLAAPIRGIADFSRLVSEDYRQYRRTIRIAWGAAIILACVSAAALWQWRAAVTERTEAQANAKQARDNAQEARANAEKADANARQADANATEAKANAQKAEASAKEARVSAEKAQANLREAQRTQSLFWADEARQKGTADPTIAALFALEALPDGTSEDDRPYVPEAELQLDSALHNVRERLVLRHDGPVLSATFSPDGKRIITASEDHTAQIWDAETGQPIGKAFSGHDKVLTAAFIPDGMRALTVSDDHTARIWDLATGQPIGEPLRGHSDAITRAAFSPDGMRIVTADDHTAHIWDAATGQPIGEPFQVRNEGGMSGVAFSRDGGRIVTADLDAARIWDAATGQPIGKPVKGLFWSAAFTPDGTRIVTAGADSYVRLWNAATGQPIGTPFRAAVFLYGGAPPFSAAFSSDGTRLVTTTWHAVDDIDSVGIWDAATGQPIGEPLRGHLGSVNSAAFSPNGTLIITGSSDKTARIWDATAAERVATTLIEPKTITWAGASFSPDGNRVVTRFDDTAQIWDAETGQPIGKAFSGHGEVLTAAFVPDGARVVTEPDNRSGTWDSATGFPIGNPSSDVRIWDAATSQPIGKPFSDSGGISIVVFSPDGKRIITASEDHTAQIWDAETGQPIGKAFSGHGKVFTAAFVPGGMRVLTVSDDHTARIWDVATGQPIGEPLRGHSDAITRAAFSPDGTRIVTVDDHTARIWDAATGQPISEPFQVYKDMLLSLACSPDGKRIFTAGFVAGAQLWDSATGQPIAERLKEASPSSISLSPDGKRIFTASFDNTAHVWDIFPDTLALVSAAKARVPRCLTLAQRKSYFLPREPPVWCINMAKWPYDKHEWKHWLADKRAGKNPPLPADAP
jgi:WD40 repeat protein